MNFEADFEEDGSSISFISAFRARLWPLVWFYALLLVAILFLLISISYPRKETIDGVVVPSSGIIEVISLRDGVATEIFVKNGQTVREGDSLLALSVDSHIQGGGQLGGLLEQAARAKAEAIDRQAEADLAARSSTLDDIRVRREALDTQIRSLESSRKLALERVANAADRVAKAELLQQRGYLSVVQVQQWQDALSSSKLAVDEFDQRRSDLIKQRKQLFVEANQLRSKAMASEATSASARAELLTAQASAGGQSQLLLTAQKGGRVTALRIHSGEQVRAGQAVAAILPEGAHLLLRVWVPSSSIGLVRVGAEANIMLDAFPYQSFGMISGRVREVASAPTAPQDLPPGTAQESRYLVLIELSAQHVRGYGRNWNLLPGMKAQAILVLEKRTLLQWLLDPVLVFQKQLNS